MKFSVPINYELSGEIEVEAASPAEAITKAREYYANNGGVDCVKYPCVDVDFAHGDDPAEVQRSEEEDDILVRMVEACDLAKERAK